MNREFSSINFQVFKHNITEYLDRDIFSNNRLYERQICKFSLVFYLNILVILLTSCTTNNLEKEANNKLDTLFSLLDSFFFFKKSVVINEVHEYAKTLLIMSNNKPSDFDDLIEFQQNSKMILTTAEELPKEVIELFKPDYFSNIKAYLLLIRKIYFCQENQLLDFLKDYK